MALFSKRLGDTPIPGEATVVLPTGKVKINYEERRQGRELDDWPGIPEDLQVTLRPAGGGNPLTVTRPRGHNEFSGSGRIGERYGQIDVTVAGEYVVTVPAFDAGRDTFEPRIAFKG
jgi:hypothetical protein